MLTASDNQLLTEVGPSTPMGKLLRRYWVPALLSSDLPEPGCPPKRVKLLGEPLVAFRDINGVLGLLGEHCPHRGASLALGRVEDGIRCLYHGWRFSADGKVQESPNCRADQLSSNARARSYPLRESGGMLWAYMGPPDKMPTLPTFHFMTVPESQRSFVRLTVDCNWVQIMEGGVDSAHIGILHADIGTLKRDSKRDDEYTAALHADDGGRETRLDSDDHAPELHVDVTDYGFNYAALRSQNEKNGKLYVRVHPFVMPWVTMIPTEPRGTIFYLPHDDEKMSWILALSSDTANVDNRGWRKIAGLEVPGAFHEEHYLGTAENGWLQDRALLDESATGLHALMLEDFAVSASMGQILDRTQEHVVASDMAVIRMRRMLLQAAKQLAEGVDPAEPVESDLSQVRAVEGFIEKGDSWRSLLSPDDRGAAKSA